MGLIDTVTQVIRRLRPEQSQRTTLDEYPSPSSPTSKMRRFQAERDRRAIVTTCREMYQTDPRAKREIKNLARDIVGGGFSIEVTDDEEAQAVADALLSRLDVVERLDDWLRLTIRDGDTFLELGVNDALEIVNVTRKPTLQMHRNSDRVDKFPDPSRAYWWADTLWAGQAPREAVWFADWQIVHARWDHDENERYGTPMFAEGTGAWKRVKEGEIDIAVRRKTRAGMKYVHVLEGAKPDELEEYKEFNKDALNNPFAAVADFFMNKKGAIEAIQGDAELSEIGDVEHHIQTWLFGGEVPMELLGYGENLNRDVLGEKKEEYDETLETLRGWAAKELIKPLVRMAWMLAGIWPGNVTWSIKWRSKQVIRPADLRDAADAALKLKVLGLSDEAIYAVLERFLPGLNLAEMMIDDQTNPRDEQEGTAEVIGQDLGRLMRNFS